MRLKDVIEVISAVDKIHVFIDGLGYIYHGDNSEFRNYVYGKWATFGTEYSSFFDAKVYRLSEKGEGIEIYAKII